MAIFPTMFFHSLAIDPLRTYPLVSEKAKGCGYDGQTDSLHTAQFSTSNGFKGIVKLQGTLVRDPSEVDWFDIDSTQLGDNITPVPDTSLIINFKGNFVWVRAVITAFTAGELNRLVFTHN